MDHPTTLNEVISLTPENKVLAEYYIHPTKVEAWREQKRAHDIPRGKYHYKEGAMQFPDNHLRLSIPDDHHKRGRKFSFKVQARG